MGIRNRVPCLSSSCLKVEERKSDVTVDVTYVCSIRSRVGWDLALWLGDGELETVGSWIHAEDPTRPPRH